jgi:hypothetical protein
VNQADQAWFYKVFGFRLKNPYYSGQGIAYCGAAAPGGAGTAEAAVLHIKN